MPGKADVVSVRGSSGEKVKKQKRHLTMTLAEVFQLFKEKYPESGIKKSKFFDFRPAEVLLAGDTPQNVCVCLYHANMCLLLESLHRECPEIPLYSREGFLNNCVCDLEDMSCVMSSCLKCKDGALIDELFPQHLENDSKIKWSSWEKSDSGYITKVVKEGTVGDALDILKRQLPKFIWHAFVKDKQAKAYQRDKEDANLLGSKTCLLQMDFAENYTCTYQDEIQSAHWRQKQVTLYTIMAYHRGEKLAMVIASDVLDHDKRTVAAFTVESFITILNTLKTVENINIWTDGPSSQYKNKYIFSLVPRLSSKYNLGVRWNYTATSHGKGPNDGLGGNVKAIAHRMVMTRQTNITNAATFVSAVSGAATSIKLIAMTDEEIESRCQAIDVHTLFEKCKPFPGTLNTHCVTVGANEKIERKFFTLSSEVMTSTSDPGEHQSKEATASTSLQGKRGKKRGKTRKVGSKKDAGTAGCERKDEGSETTCKSSGDNCGHCGDNYYDCDDDDNEDWIQCQDCDSWFHITCAGVYGKSATTFSCSQCE